MNSGKKRLDIARERGGSVLEIKVSEEKGSNTQDKEKGTKYKMQERKGLERKETTVTAREEEESLNEKTVEEGVKCERRVKWEIGNGECKNTEKVRNEGNQMKFRWRRQMWIQGRERDHI